MKEKFEEILKDLSDDYVYCDTPNQVYDVWEEEYKRLKKVWSRLKCDPKPYSRIYWYYKDDLEFAKTEGLDVREMQYCSGIIIPPPFNQSLDMFEPFEHGIVIIDRYPTEMCAPDVDWICLKRLLQDDNLVEVYQ